ncbi:MAG: tRNA (guanosine(37)-N1)-methyltransferase TrmD [Actinomycetaceae bacterium]|nr:tRNA (guanosine(37)-N1)-methyltransferase TrmD [Actinomycetaceae bacterium]
MRFDVVSIFPQYFDVLDLSLVGKARKRGLLSIKIHDLRDYASDPHKTVDDTPYGGGPGMVMRPDIWGKALDDIMGPESPGSGMKVLAVPTPSGEPLSQRTIEGLAHSSDQIIFACGRYEGIDERVTEHYRQRSDVWVLEYSMGDYIVNGGEVAALAVIEAVGRLVEGVVGNTESVKQESFSEEGLLESPVYTKPATWRGINVPEVLTKGNHKAIERWRRDRALERTLKQRPDLIRRINGHDLDIHDRELLASLGVLVSPTYANFSMRLAQPDDAQALATLAARLFPMACPKDLDRQSIQRHIDEEFSLDKFTHMLAQPDTYRIMLGYVSISGSTKELIAYSLVENISLDSKPSHPEVAKVVPPGTAELSKLYVDKAWQGSGVAGVLMQSSFDDIHGLSPEAPAVVVSTHERNKRADIFYRRHGFRKVGKRTYNVGGQNMSDNVYLAALRGHDIN